MRLAWATDVHLNFLSREARSAFADAVTAERPDALLLTGDISEAPLVAAHLVELAGWLARPVYFVLGNHDYYRGTIAETRAVMRLLTQQSPWLRWLPAAGVLALTDRVALVGHDGWADGRAGDFHRSPVRLNDDLLIAELRQPSREALLATIQRYGDEAAAFLSDAATRALASHERVLVATHVPPYREACWHEGAISDDDWLPRFTCVAAGEALSRVMAAHPHRSMTVLCGHTHSPGVARPSANLEVRTGGARYGAPALAGVLEL